MLNTFCPGRGSNQDLLRGSQTLYRVAIKAGLYRKAVQVCIIPNITTRPFLEYGSSVWDPYTQCLLDDLEKSQKRAAMFVTRNYAQEEGSMTGILELLKWESLKKRRKDNRLILLYKGMKV